ncbi:MAG: hypothetical protein DMG70_25735 [Acidobacteria bacterium]|nr:MAG: hypothetical protein DMG70_25735 [Acidobacteriota bacterium]
MLVKWMLAFGLQGTALITVTPAGLAQTVQQSPTPVMCQTLGQPQEVASAKLSLLDSGFRSMYELDFSGAQQQFAEYERENPGDPMGPVSEAADVLFSEFNRLGVLQSQMFIKDPSFAAGGNLAPDPAVLGKFDVAIERSQALAEKRLVGDGNDRDALLASAFAAGLQAECLALVQKRNLAALHCARQATSYAQRLLAVCPDCYDAYVATGVGKYLIGSRTLPVRWILRANGFAGDKREGIKELQIAAEYGHYLAPFAEILLSIAYLRDKELQKARVLLADLRAEFPENSVFASELQRLDGVAAR